MNSKKSIVIIFYSLALFLNGYSQTCAVIKGLIKHSKSNAIRIVLEYNETLRESSTINVLTTEGKLFTKIPVLKPTFFSASDGVNYFNGILEPADTMSFSYDADDMEHTLVFEGKGDKKFSFLGSYMQFNLSKKLKEQVLVARTKQFPFDYLFGYLDSVRDDFLTQLSDVRTLFSKEGYDLIVGNIMGNYMLNRYRSVGLVYHESIDETLQNQSQKLTNTSREALLGILTFDSSYFNSSDYVNDVYNVLFMEYDSKILAEKLNNGLPAKYNYLKHYLPSKLQTPVLTLFLEYDINKLNQGEDIDRIIAETYISPADSLYKKFIVDHYNTVAIFKKGIKAPDFTAENAAGETVSLQTFKGKVIFIDFWYAACGPCLAMFQRLAPVKERYADNHDVVFLCVSTDPKETWMAALKKFAIPGYHVYTQGRGFSHPMIKDYKVQGYPTTLIIDRKSNVFIANPSSDINALNQQIDQALAQ